MSDWETLTMKQSADDKPLRGINPDEVTKEFTCSSCGKSFEYEGRKPRRCENCKSITRVDTTRSIKIIVQGLEELYTGLGTVWAFVQPEDGLAVVVNANKLASSWEDLLERDPRVRRAMSKMMAGAGWGTVIAVHLSVFGPMIISHHGEKLSHLVNRGQNSNGDSEVA